MNYLSGPLRFFSFLLPFSFLFIALCCKDSSEQPKPVEPQPEEIIPDSLAGVLKLEFRNHVDGLPLLFTPNEFKSPAQDTFRVDDFKYYISNVKLRNTQTGRVYTEKNSYHLIEQQKGKTSFVMNRIPVKGFDVLEFSVGVDAVQNASTAKTGDLDANNNMAWDWNTGYIFMRFGGFQVKKGVQVKGLRFHVGDNVNYKTFTFPLSQVNFVKNKPYTARIGANINELFRTPQLIDFDVMYDVMDGSDATTIANNYETGMFTLDEVEQQ